MHFKTRITSFFYEIIATAPSTVARPLMHKMPLNSNKSKVLTLPNLTVDESRPYSYTIRVD